jgi:hypothetical protein
MIEWLFLDGIDGKATGATITGHDDLLLEVLPDKTQTPLTIM